MTVVRPYLILNRLVVRAGETVAYDEKFHAGLNIIRGSNSSGKSSILDFVFFVLGGDIRIWKTAASKCTDVSAEVDVNGTIVTLQRKVTTTAMSSMAIYWGTMEESEKHHFQNWSEYPYKGNESFSKVLFRALGYPEVKADQDSNLTMHQILRMVYVDQISRTTALMREEDFDSPLTRRTIADLLFGVYDDTLYADEMNLKIRERELRDISLQVIHTEDILRTVDEKLDVQDLKKRVDKLKISLAKINAELEKTQDEANPVRDTSQTETEKLRRAITVLREETAKQSDRIQELEVDIADSDLFLTNLRARLAAIGESLITRDALGDLPACPLCTVSLKQVDGKILCDFSGKSIPGDFGRSNMLKMGEELRFQIKESESLQRERIEEMQKIAEERSALLVQLEQQSQTFRQKVRAVKTARDNRLDELYQSKGRVEAEIENTSKLGKYLDVLTNLTKRQGQLKGFVAEIETIIQSKRRKQQGRWEQALAAIQQAAVWILAHDFKRQAEFSNVESLHLRFDKNTYLLNGRNNFSASSTTLLKNAIHFGVMFASTEDAEFRYPRFILSDNAEDGGMEEERSKNFQKIIAEMAKQATLPFQIILSTSKINPELESPEFCVGEIYSEANKSLKLPDDLQKAAIAAEQPAQLGDEPTNSPQV